MQEAKKTSKVFYAIDTHWTDLGAFLAYQQVSQIMREDYPAVKFRPLSDFDQEKKTIISGDLTPTFGHLVVEEEVTVLHPKFESEYLITNIGRSPTNRDIVLTYADNPDLPTAVVYRDSFFTGLIKFVAENFREARYYWSFKPDYNEIYAAKPDYLILEVTERYLKTAIFNLPEPNSE